MIVERDPTVDESEQSDAHRPDIGCFPAETVAVLQSFGGRESWRPRGRGDESVRTVEFVANAQIRDLNPTGLAEEEIRRFDVSVDDSLIMY